MIRKFECKNCQNRFEADDAGQVLCPKCNSDNVEYAQFHIPSKVWKIAGGILLLLIIGVIVSQIKWCDGSGPKTDGSIAEKDSTECVQDSTYLNETGLSLPPVINVGELTFEEKGYQFEVTVENPPSLKFYYAIVDPYNSKKIIAKSDDGKFKDVPCSEADGGMFDISLMDASADTLICSIQKPGFIKQKAVTKKMTAEELQSKINNRDATLMGVGENDYLSPEYTLKLNGLSSDAVNIPSTLGEVFDKLDNEIWESVKVTSLEYDDMNRINKIVLSVKDN